MFCIYNLLIINEINAICNIASDDNIVFSTSRNNLRLKLSHPKLPLRRSDFDLPAVLFRYKLFGRFGLLCYFDFPMVINIHMQGFLIKIGQGVVGLPLWFTRLQKHDYHAKFG